MQCAICQTINPDDDVFCENCGARFGDAPVAAVVQACVCGASFSEMDEDGFCGGCGRRMKRPDSDHIEVTLMPDFAGVSDRGLRHNRNEDRFAIAASGGVYGLVVCDGVSMSPNADEAAQAAAQGTIAALNDGMAKGGMEDIELLKSSIRSGTDAVSALGRRQAEAPATTLVAAIVKGGKLTVGWIGDSRAYWLNAGEAKQITNDHSWQNSAAAQFAGAEAKAANSHALARWVGADAADLEPEIVQQQVNGAGMLLLCSDGLWNYTKDEKEMALLVTGANKPGADALAISRELVEFARDQGGHDNITAVILRHPAWEEHSNG